MREVREETGLVCTAPELRATSAESGEARLEHCRRAPVLVATGITRRFPIRPEWQDRYGPGITENLEHLFYLELPRASSLTLNADEHVACRWMGLEEAIDKVASWTNREALEKLRVPGTHRQQGKPVKPRGGV